MKSLRVLISLVLAAGVTGALFFMMLTLIDSSELKVDDEPQRKLANIHMPEREIENRVKEERAQKPDDVVEPPPDFQPPQQDNFDVSPDTVNLAPNQGLDLNISVGVGLNSSDGEYLPIVKVNPTYPRRANSRGIEGYCTVEYTVTANGSIKNPVPVDCLPKGVFEKASVKAALKFKYKPRVVDGVAIEVPGVLNKFTFQLEQ